MKKTMEAWFFFKNISNRNRYVKVLSLGAVQIPLLLSSEFSVSGYFSGHKESILRGNDVL